MTFLKRWGEGKGKDWTSANGKSHDAAVSSGSASGMGPSAKLGQHGFVKLTEELSTFCVRTQGEQLLFKAQVCGQGGSKLERDRPTQVEVDLRLFHSGQFEDFKMQRKTLFPKMLCGFASIVISKEIDFSLQKGPGVVEMFNLKAFTALAQDVHAAITVLMQNTHN
jgi:hypothetical protein